MRQSRHELPQMGHGTKRDIGGTCPANKDRESGTDRTHPFRGCPDIPPRPNKLIPVTNTPMKITTDIRNAPRKAEKSTQLFWLKIGLNVAE